MEGSPPYPADCFLTICQQELAPALRRSSQQVFRGLLVYFTFFFLHDFWTYQCKYKLYGSWGDCCHPGFNQTQDPCSPWVDSKEGETL